MKNVLIILIAIFSINAHAQSDAQLKTFAKEYYEHFKKNDFDWIMVNYATNCSICFPAAA